MVVAPREDKTTLGIVAMALAVGFFTLIDTSGKWLMLAGLPALQVVFCRYAGHFLVALLAYAPKEGLGVMRSNSPGKQFLRSGFLLGSTIFNFSALQYLPITVTTTIMFAGPVFVTLLSIPLLGEKVGIYRLMAVFVGFLGVIVVMQPWGTAFHPAMFLSIGALCSASLYFVMTRMLAGVESNATSQLWSSGLASAVLVPFVITSWQWPETLTGYVVLVLIGIFGAAGHILATSAHRLAEASILAPVIYIQLGLAALAGVLVFHTWPTPWTFVGGLIIIASGLFIWQRERTKGRELTSPDPRRAPR